jgi:tetraprenyl-beta-curcumene synthase
VRRSRGTLAERVSQSGVFAAAALRYWLLVFPRVASELRHVRRLAGRIPDPALRQTALEALGKRGNLEGAAAFATFAPRRQRRSVVRAVVSFQAIYNHADMLAEQPGGDPIGGSRHLHEALLAALDLDRVDGLAVRQDLGAVSARDNDGGYVAALIERCHAALAQLPAYACVAPSAQRAAVRIVDFQSLSLGSDGELKSWARRQIPTDGGLEWWEIAAAGGSSLGVHALIAAAASPSLGEQDVAAIEAAYFPSIGALHSLLDSLVDRSEDAATGQLSLIGCYPSVVDGAAGLRRLTEAAAAAARQLPDARAHSLLLAGMACSYLAMPEASTPEAESLARGVRASIGPSAGAMLHIFRLRELAARVTPGASAVGSSSRSGAAARVETGERGADARVA